VIHLEDFSRTLKDGNMIAWIEMILGATGPLLWSLTRRLRDDPPDLLVFDGIAVWGEMLASKLKLPSVAISTTFTSDAFGRSWDQILRDLWAIVPLLPKFAWDAIRVIPQGLLDLPHTLPLIPRRGDVTVMLTSREFHPPSRYRDDRNFVFVGCAIDPATRSETFDFSRLDGRPLLYVSLGTLHHGNAHFFDTCIAAFRDYAGQVLVSVGRGTDLSRYSSAPSNFIFAETVPQLAVLERTSVFLTHGGLNSVHEALWHGVPMVAVPQQIEQLHNAEAMQQAGAGLVIEQEAKSGAASVADLRHAVDRVMADRTTYAAAAARIGASLREGGGIEEAASIIERRAAMRSARVHPEAAIRPSSEKV
jgi:MGT family glycosyltransferase